MATRPIKTILQASRRVSRIGAVIQQSADRKARHETRIARAQRRLDEAKAGHQAEQSRTAAQLERLALPLLDFFADHRHLDRQSLEVGTGVLAIREDHVGSAVFTASEQEVAEEILRLDPITYGEIVKITYKVSKTALKEHPGLLDQLTTVHIEHGDTFSVQPHNTKGIFRRPVSALLALLSAQTGEPTTVTSPTAQ